LQTTEISAILADFCLNFVSIATPFAPLKIPIVYISVRRLLEPILFTQKIALYFIKIEICAILAFFYLNLVVMATALDPLKFPIAYLSSLPPPQKKTLPYTQKLLPYLVHN